MTERTDGVIAGQVIHLDGRSFKGFTFVNCRMVYSGAGTVGISDCRFHDCDFEFEGAAGNALAFLNAIAGDPGLRSLLPSILPNLVRPARLN